MGNSLKEKEIAARILYKHARKNHDGFMTGQIRWIITAMFEFKNKKQTK